MDSPYLDPRYEPPAIKAALPVEWVLGRLFGAWGAGDGEMIACPLPGHLDDTPSFNLWAPNEDGVPMRFGCFGCGVNGDVIDLIRIQRGLGFTDACTYAVDVLEPEFGRAAWTPAEVSSVIRAPADPVRLEEALAGYQHGPEILRTFLEAKDLLHLGDYARSWWQWTGAYVGMPVVVFPHRDWEGTLRGLRYRSVRRGNRWTEKGSRFDALYGAWMDEKHPDVLLCEGETDTVFAAWDLDGDPIDVLGLASGAAQKPPAEALERLAARSVTLAFDGDMAGRIATTRWSAALKEVGCRVRRARIPDGEDVCSWAQPALDLVRGAEDV